MLSPTNPQEYSELWEKESHDFERQGVYARLNATAPQQRALEVGCGIGLGTAHLAATREVLALDNNASLITKATEHISARNVRANIRYCDLFALTPDDLAAIRGFEAKGIVAWFIGSDGQHMYERTPDEPNPITKSKKYRENIEDIITSDQLCTPTIEWIHFAARSRRLASGPIELACSDTIKDYDTHVFSRIGFRVCSVEIFDWDINQSTFQYAATHHPAIDPNSTVPCITSILAKRI